MSSIDYSGGDGAPALIAYTVRFLDFVMEALEEWYRAVLGSDWYQLTVDQGLGSPIVHLEFDFVSPLKPGDEVHVTVLVEKIGRSTIDFAFSGWRHSAEQSFSARLTACFVDSTGERIKATPIPDHYRQRIERYKAACATPAPETARRRG